MAPTRELTSAWALLQFLSHLRWDIVVVIVMVRLHGWSMIELSGRKSSPRGLVYNFDVFDAGKSWFSLLARPLRDPHNWKSLSSADQPINRWKYSISPISQSVIYQPWYYHPPREISYVRPDLPINSLCWCSSRHSSSQSIRKSIIR